MKENETVVAKIMKISEAKNLIINGIVNASGIPALTLKNIYISTVKTQEF